MPPAEAAPRVVAPAEAAPRVDAPAEAAPRVDAPVEAVSSGGSLDFGVICVASPLDSPYVVSFRRCWHPPPCC